MQKRKRQISDDQNEDELSQDKLAKKEHQEANGWNHSGGAISNHQHGASSANKPPSTIQSRPHEFTGDQNGMMGGH